ncbi:MAG: cation:proton antiporter [Paludibacteraceae bacterium]|nr:cation:proton antiporter [Paludibacteraceae bacterium]
MNSFLQSISEHFSTIPFQDPVLVFLLVLSIILFTPLLFRKIKIPYIIGLILAGVLFGPHGLNLLANDKSFELLGKVGILYIMFLAGLDLDLKEFKENKYKSIIFGFFTFIFPLSIGFPICHYVLGFSVQTSLLTAAMFSTHTLVSYPIVSNMHLSRNKAVTTTIGGTIFTDTAVLLILAFVLDQNSGSGHTAWAWMLLSLVLFLAIMFFVIPKISAWFFKKFENEKQSHFIYALSIMFFAAFIAELAGLEAIIGAFLAGLVMNRFIPHSSALMNRIEFIGNSLFIPFFLISVGMMVNLSILLQGFNTIIVALTLSVVAIVGKWLAAFVTQKTFRFSKAQRNVILGLSSSHAAATLAIILAGFQAGIIDETILNGTIILILITCIFSSFVTQKAASKLVKEDNNLQEDKKEQETRILIPIANPQTSQNLIETALLMKNQNKRESFYALSIIDDPEATLPQRQKGQQLLEESAKIAAASDNLLHTITRYDINVGSGIIHTIKENHITDVFLGTSPETTSITLLEKTSDRIPQQFEQNVFVLRNRQPVNTLKRIVVAIPPRLETEPGFLNCFKRIRNLSLQLNTKIVFFSTEETAAYLKVVCKDKNTKLAADFRDLPSWEDFLIIKKIIKENDLLVVFMARKNSKTHNNLFGKIPYYLTKFFQEFDTMLIFPKQDNSESGKKKFF